MSEIPLASSSVSVAEGFGLGETLGASLTRVSADGTVGTYFVNGAGFTYVDQRGIFRMIPYGVVFDAQAGAVPAGWLPPPDSTLLFPMDEDARAVLQFSVNLERNATGGIVPPGIGGLDPHIPVWMP